LSTIPYCKTILQIFPRSQAPAWERVCARSPCFGPSPVTVVQTFLSEPGSRGTSPASAFPSRGLGTRKDGFSIYSKAGFKPALLCRTFTSVLRIV